MKINKHLLTVLFSILLLNCFSQQITINRLFNPDSLTTSEGGAIIKNGNGYIIQVIELDSIQRLLFFEIDSVGNLNKIVKFKNDTIFYYSGFGALINTHDGGYCYIDDIQTPSKMLHFMVRFNKNMDTLWTRYFDHDTIFQSLMQICETSDKGFVMVGEKDIISNTSNILIFKTDSLGNKLWEKNIATGGFSRAWQVRETPDKGLLICCFKSTVGPFILKTDSAGNLKWSSYPNLQNYNGSGAIAVTNEGDYLFAYGFGTFTQPSGIDNLSKINVIKYNPQGSVIWDKKFDTITEDLYCMKIEVLPNGDFYVLSNYLIGDYIGAFFQTNALLMKFNCNGDSLWTQRYSYTGDNGSTNVLYDGVATNDGGFIACGYVSNQPSYGAHIWVVKTDSLGNAPGMHYLDLGIKEINKLSSKGDIKAFPNPATNQTTIVFPQLKGEGELQIYNTLGQLVYQEKLAKASSQKEINIQSFKIGLYKVIVREKGIIKGQVSLIKN